MPDKKTAAGYVPKGREKDVFYVPEDDKFIQEARRVALEGSLDKTQKTGVVLVKNGKVIGRGANGSDYHDKNDCERKRLNIPSGEGYELCEGCHPKNHAEATAIRDATANGFSTDGAHLYMWGHFYACEACWKAIEEAGVRYLYLLEGSDVLFDRTKKGNIIGRYT